MPVILSLETSTTVCSVALHEENRLLCCSELMIQRSHAEKITLLVDQTLQNGGLKLKDIGAVAVSKGPGSYTGLRIGSSTAKGYCFGLDIPLIGIPTLQAMAYKWMLTGFWVCPMLDARRMEVYCAVYDGENREIIPANALILDKHSFSDLLEQNQIVFFGNGSDKFRKLVNHPNAHFLPDVYSSAIQVGALAYAKYQASVFENSAQFEPHYLKEFYTTR